MSALSKKGRVSQEEAKSPTQIPEHVLQGLKVLEMAQAGVGPMQARALAMEGATVLRIESSKQLDMVRGLGPFNNLPSGHVERSIWYPIHHPCKYSLRLNLKHPKAMAVMTPLIKWADLIVESFRPGAIEGLGLSYEEVRKIKPDIIMLSTSNLGHTGVVSTFRGTGNNLVGMSGWTELTGWPDRPAVQPHSSYTDWLIPPLGLSAIMAALLNRRRTGKGTYLDLSQLEASLHYMLPLLLDYQANGRIATRAGNRNPYAAPQGVYQCQGDERWCAIAVETDEEWRKLCEVMGRHELADAPEFRSFPMRKRNEDKLDQLLQEWTKQYKAEVVMEKLQNAGIAASVVQNAQDVFEDPELRSKGYFIEIDDTLRGRISYDINPFTFSKTRKKVERAAYFGEHTQQVCMDIIKMSEQEYASLQEDGVFN
ncbi:CaiB/BaiF CoA transferase family protein [Chloroflexota bacterium]